MDLTAVTFWNVANTNQRARMGLLSPTLRCSTEFLSFNSNHALAFKWIATQWRAATYAPSNIKEQGKHISCNLENISLVLRDGK
jgi:hypothetical protein